MFQYQTAKSKAKRSTSRSRKTSRSRSRSSSRSRRSRSANKTPSKSPSQTRSSRRSQRKEEEKPEAFDDTDKKAAQSSKTIVSNSSTSVSKTSEEESNSAKKVCQYTIHLHMRNIFWPHFVNFYYHNFNDSILSYFEANAMPPPPPPPQICWSCILKCNYCHCISFRASVNTELFLHIKQFFFY